MKYEEPIIEVVRLDDDVIRTSNGDGEELNDMINSESLF